MLLERFESEGLSQFSYLIGYGRQAVVIDPRRDFDIYVKIAEKKGLKITDIFETHRNEDYLTGSRDLGEITKANVWHADSHLDYKYGKPAKGGKKWRIGRLKLQAIHTPGHTLGSMSYILYDTEGFPWMIFTGDTLFAGDVGRVDLYGPEKTREMANMLYDTIFEKILPLGDEVIVCPAHGSGSLCGNVIVDRPLTTIGIEKKHNPILKNTERDKFILKTAKELEKPPYFKKMEELNLNPPSLLAIPPVLPLTANQFDKEAENSIILDSRTETDFCASHIPNSIYIWPYGISKYAGWFLSYTKPIILVCYENDLNKISRYLARLGFDNIKGYLSGGMHSWLMRGKEVRRIKTIRAKELCSMLDVKEKVWILDVRNIEEVEESGTIPNSHNINILELSERLESIPYNENIVIYCGSGMRSTLAASILENEVLERKRIKITAFMGGIYAWKAEKCPVERKKGNDGG